MRYYACFLLSINFIAEAQNPAEYIDQELSSISAAKHTTEKLKEFSLVSSFYLDRRPAQLIYISSEPAITEDGSLVVFTAQATTRYSPQPGPRKLYFQGAQEKKRAPRLIFSTCPTLGVNTEANAYDFCDQPSLGALGKFLSFRSGSVSRAAPDGEPLESQIYLLPLSYSPEGVFKQDNMVELVSGLHKRVDNKLKVSEKANGTSAHPVLIETNSGMNRYVIFDSDATNLVRGSKARQIYRKEMDGQSNTLEIISSTRSKAKNQEKYASSGPCSKPDADERAHFIVFECENSNLIEGVRGTQIYAKDQLRDKLYLISSIDSTQKDQTLYQGNASSRNAKIARDFRNPYVVFESDATNFGQNTSGTQIYIKNLAQLDAPPRIVSSLNSFGKQQAKLQGNAPSRRPRISADGKTILFESAASNFFSNIKHQQIYIKRSSALRQKPEILSSQKPESSDQSDFQGNRDSFTPAPNFDASVIAFGSTAKNLSRNTEIQEVLINGTFGQKAETNQKFFEYRLRNYKSEGIPLDLNRNFGTYGPNSSGSSPNRKH